MLSYSTVRGTVLDMCLYGLYSTRDRLPCHIEAHVVVLWRPLYLLVAAAFELNFAFPGSGIFRYLPNVLSSYTACIFNVSFVQ